MTGVEILWADNPAQGHKTSFRSITYVPSTTHFSHLLGMEVARVFCNLSYVRSVSLFSIGHRSSKSRRELRIPIPSPAGAKNLFLAAGDW